MGILSRSPTSSRRPEDGMKLLTIVLFAIAFGILLGLSFPSFWITKANLPKNLLHSIAISHKDSETETPSKAVETPKIFSPSNPRGTERLPPGIIASESDLYLRKLWGNPEEDLIKKPRYLATFTVGFNQRHNVDACVKKFSDNFTIVLFHYDGKTSEWNNEFEWSKTAIHISVRKQTKWWYAKRFLHPDIVAKYEYIFIWDEDLGLDHFNAEEYIRLVKKHGLEISQPGLDPERGFTWQITKRREHSEVHKVETGEKLEWCSHPPRPPCAAFVEIMAPVFSIDAWRCVWHMIQNDLVHGWGLDFALRRCVETAHEKIGIVDSQWIVHQFIPSLGNEGKADSGKPPWEGVRDRCHMEWKMFQKRVEEAEKDYLESLQVESPSNSTTFSRKGRL